MSRCNERQKMHLQCLFIFINETQIANRANKLINTITTSVGMIYAKAFQLLTHCTHIARKQYQYTYGTMSAMTEKIEPFFKNKQRTSQEESISKPLQIQSAKKFHQQELAALNYILCLRVTQTIDIIEFNLKSFQTLFNQAEYHYKDQLSPHQFESFLETIQNLTDSLRAKEKILREENVSHIKAYIKDIFKSMHAFQLSLKEIEIQLPKKSPEKKEFIKLWKILVNQVNKQQKIHQDPSSDPYLYNLQQNEKQAWMKLEGLMD